ncbi:MAG: UDP-3-O-(3-hydroxymyristoyl)glucosamine N-acyltransferase [Bacteroidota bacterium]
MKVQEIAAWFQGEVVGDPRAEIDRVSKIEEADRGSLTFLANPKYEKHLATTRASAVLVSRKLDLSKYSDRASCVFIRVDDPYMAFLRALKNLTPSEDPFPSGIAPTAVASDKARVGKNVVLGSHVVVEEGAVIGDNTKISHGCVIGKKVEIGSDCLIYPNVSIGHGCRIGDRVILHSGVVIGSDGFGFVPKQDGRYEKIPQLGIAVVGDDVEVGANTTIDRATIGETVIGRGVKLDNLIQIAHNVVIGENTVIAAQTGISGSAKIGKNCIIAGQVGIAGHVEIADRVTILGQTGITKSLETPGAIYFGYPGRPIREAHRIQAAIHTLPEMVQELTRLEHQVAELRKERAVKRPRAHQKVKRIKKKQ